MKELFIAVAISIDVYLAAVAYYKAGTRIPVPSAAAIALTGAAVLCLSIKFSSVLVRFFPRDRVRLAGAIALCVIGSGAIAKSLKGRRKKTPPPEKALPEKLSPLDGAALAAVSSFDAAAIGLGNPDVRLVPVFVIAFVCGAAAVFLGNITGKKAASLNKDVSWIGGVMLIALAFLG